ncbi:MAG: TetR/AcrR family transcriptional regulator [Myxococcota bacterium]
MAIHSATKRRSSVPDKRERILNAAIKVFAKNGFYATRVSEIAKAAGVADGTIYLYFKNKDDVLISIFEDGITRLLEIIRDVAASEDTVEQRITRIIEMQLGLLEDQRDLAEVITVNLRQSSRLLKQYGAPLFMEYIDVLAGVIEEGQKQGVFRKGLNPRVGARALFGALDAILLTWALGDADPAALRRSAGHCTTLFLDGLRQH